MFTVYCRTNIVNGKRYIGLTSMSLEERAGTNGSRYINCPCLYNAIQKYGWNNFESIALATNLTHKKACELEKYYIELYNTVAPNGYNLTVGGDSGYVHTESTKKIISQKLKGNKSRTGYKNSEHWKQVMSKRMSGNTNNKGRKVSDNQKQLLMYGQPHRISVMQYTIAGEFVAEFASLKDAERHTGVAWQNIGKVVAGKPGHHTAGGYVWKKRGK